MAPRFTSLAIIAALASTHAVAGPSGQHSAQSVDLSTQASSHGSAAFSRGAATVASVPILLFGSILTVSGAGLENIGEGALDLGLDLSDPHSAQPAAAPIVTPDGPPTLD